VFGDRPQPTLDDGLQRMAAWVKQHGARASRPFEGIEITRNLPRSWVDV
jgi:UDP-glucose 4-epimerase